MTSRASSTTKKATAAKKPAKKRTPKSPEARSGPVVVSNLRDRVHPGLLASALDLADGDMRRIESDSWGSITVTM